MFSDFDARPVAALALPVVAAVSAQPSTIRRWYRIVGCANVVLRILPNGRKSPRIWNYPKNLGSPLPA